LLRSRAVKNPGRALATIAFVALATPRILLAQTASEARSDARLGGRLCE